MERDPLKWISVRCECCCGKGRTKQINPRWLRAKRVSAGKGVREMGRYLGVSAAYLSDIERGRRKGNQAIIEGYGTLREM